MSKNDKILDLDQHMSRPFIDFSLCQGRIGFCYCLFVCLSVKSWGQILIWGCLFVLVCPFKEGPYGYCMEGTWGVLCIVCKLGIVCVWLWRGVKRSADQKLPFRHVLFGWVSLWEVTLHLLWGKSQHRLTATFLNKEHFHTLCHSLFFTNLCF